jgi:hypothetical protein
VKQSPAFASTMITLKKQYEANWRLEDIFTEIKDIKA